MSFEPIESQEALDAIIKDRVDRAKKAGRSEAEKEAAEKYGDYEALKKAATDAKEAMAGKDARIKELEEAEKGTAKTINDLNAKISGLELTQTKIKVANETGLPLQLAARLAGETEEEIRADAESMKGLIGGKKVAPLGSYENEPQDSTRSLLKGMLDGMRD